MKTCGWCKKSKDNEKFAKKGKTTSSFCKDCKNEYNKEWYKVNAKRHKETVKVNKTKYITEKLVLFNALKDNPCTDCGRLFPPYAMDFDHIPGKKKVKSISRMIRSQCSNELILKEIEKCELVCACCHRIRTYNRGEFIL